MQELGASGVENPLAGAINVFLPDKLNETAKVLPSKKDVMEGKLCCPSRYLQLLIAVGVVLRIH